MTTQTELLREALELADAYANAFNNCGSSLYNPATAAARKALADKIAALTQPEQAEGAKIEVTKDWCIRMAMLEIETGADMEIGGASTIASPETDRSDVTDQPASQMADPIPAQISADLERSDWTPEEALRWYAAGKHYDTVGGRARILDNGAVASNALKALSLEYAKHKGDVALLESATPPQAEQANVETTEAHGELTGCACRWDKDDKRVQTCERHQGWLDVVHEWAERAKLAEQAEASKPLFADLIAATPGAAEELKAVDVQADEVIRRYDSA